MYKKLDPSDKANYRPVSVLPLLKLFEKIIYDQLYEYLENFLSKLLCGFRSLRRKCCPTIEERDLF